MPNLYNFELFFELFSTLLSTILDSNTPAKNVMIQVLQIANIVLALI
jgi:hypothetical protein